MKMIILMMEMMMITTMMMMLMMVWGIFFIRRISTYLLNCQYHAMIIFVTIHHEVLLDNYDKDGGTMTMI